MARGPPLGRRMEAIYDSLIAFVFGTLGVDKLALKAAFHDAGLGYLWDFVRDYVLDYRVWLLGLVPCLLLEMWRRARPEQKIFSPYLAMDALYPAFQIPIQMTVAVGWVTAWTFLRENYLAWANLGVLGGLPMWAQVAIFFLINDFLFWFSHMLRHKVRFLWYFHAIHHSQEHLNAMTTNRSHYGDGWANAVIKAVPYMILGGSLPSFMLYLVLNNFWGYFIHANIRTNLGPLKWVLVSPQFHRVHHSVEPDHFDKNYGERLILWDWMFGTMVKDFDCYPRTGVYGMERWAVEQNGRPTELLRAFVAQLWWPFYKNGQYLRSILTGRAMTPAQASMPTADQSVGPVVGGAPADPTMATRSRP